MKTKLKTKPEQLLDLFDNVLSGCLVKTPISKKKRKKEETPAITLSEKSADAAKAALWD